MLTDEEFRLFRNLVYDESGIYLKETKKDFLENRVSRRMQETKTPSPYRYYQLVTGSTRAELLRLLDAMTVNETSFFRNQPQFDLFRNLILPGVTAKNQGRIPKRLSIWSAGCATGEEPYSIAMTLLEAVPDIFEWDVKVLASDLSMSALAYAHRGEYPANKVKEAVPPEIMAKYIETDGDVCRVRDRVRRLVVFDFHNLKHENGITEMDAVFCRNVMIYFDEEEQRRLVRKLYRCLSPGGYLLLGHAESLHGWNTRFRFVFERKGTAYRRPDGEEEA